MKPHRNRNREAGAVLVLVMMVIIVLFSIGITALWTTSGNTKVSSNMNLRQQALYCAEAGVERARAYLNSGIPNVNSLLGGSNPGAGDDIPSSTNLTGRGAIMLAPPDTGGTAENLVSIPYPSPSFGRTGGSVTAPTAASMGTYNVWLKNDIGEIRRGLYTQDNNMIVTIRSQGIAPDGVTQVTIDVTVGYIPGSPGAPGTATANVTSLCAAGKNACDENNSTASGIVAQ